MSSLLHHEIRRAKDRIKILAPIMEERSFVTNDPKNTESKGAPTQKTARKVRFPPILDVRASTRHTTRLPLQRPRELDLLIEDYLEKAAEYTHTKMLGYDPTLYCECCQPMNLENQSRIREHNHSDVTQADSQESDSLGHELTPSQHRQKINVHKRTKLEQKRSSRSNQNGANSHSLRMDTDKNRSNHKTKYTYEHSVLSQEPRSENYMNRFLLDPKIYVDASKRRPQPSRPDELSFTRLQSPPGVEKSNFYAFEEVLSATTRYDNSMQALKDTIRKLEEDQAVIRPLDQ